MNETEILRWQLERYSAVLAQQTEKLYNALEELQRNTLLLTNQEDITDAKIDKWLDDQGFAVDEDGFFQSIPLLKAFRNECAPENALSISWGKDRLKDPVIRKHMYCHRNIGSHLKHIHDRLGDIGWIYYQDAANASFQYPYIDQKEAITFDFDWTSYHTFMSVCPKKNSEKKICWTPPTVDYAGEGIIISVSIPVWDNDNFIGLWSIDLPIRYLYRDFSLSKAFPGQSQFIIDSKGTLILHDKLRAEINQKEGKIFFHILKELGGEWKKIDLNNLIKKEADTCALKDSEGREWFYCYEYLSGVEWILFSGLPKSEMEDAAAKRLREAFQQISDGDYSQQVEASPSGTMSVLVEEFNIMSAKLKLSEEHREKMEKQLRQAQKMEAVGRLAGGVAHDFNNMTSVIMGYTELVMEKLDKEDPMYSDLSTVLETAHRSKELTRQLLAFARQQSISPKTLDINFTVESMLKILNSLIGEDIEIIWHPGNNIWPVFIDPSQVDQVLANLCVNARDAIKGVGKIIIETASREFDEDYCSTHHGFIPGSYTQLTVTDDGEGMDAVTLNNIFEPFFSTKPAGYGTGLGLATVYGIIKQNNGFVNAYSEPGHGTTFKVYLPRAADTPLDDMPKNVNTSPHGSSELILLVEDDPAILTLTERVLKKLGYRVITAGSPVIAVDIAKKQSQPVDILLTDVIMPELNGRDLANLLKDIYPDLKVLFMSGYTSNVIVHRGVLDKDVFLLQKPFTRKDLAAKLEEVLSSDNKTP